LVLFVVPGLILPNFAVQAAKIMKMGCRGDMVVDHFSGRFGVLVQKSHFLGDFLHFGVAATLCKIVIHARMGA
jgi:hypothetical protein